MSDSVAKLAARLRKSLAIATAARRALLHLARNDRVSLSDRYSGTICPRARLAPPVSAQRIF